jgi:hypothetical protein
MIEVDRDKLVKILRMFSSDHDGEVAAAARRAHKLVRDRSLDWDDLIIATGRNSQSRQAEPPPPTGNDEADLIHRCAERPHCLTAWENEFIANISESIVEWGRLTPKQRSVLDRIVNKLKVRGVWDDI